MLDVFFGRNRGRSTLELSALGEDEVSYTAIPTDSDVYAVVQCVMKVVGGYLEHFKIDTDIRRIHAGTTFCQLNMDSIDVVEFFMEIEDELDIGIPDEDTQKMRRLGDVVGYLMRNRNKCYIRR